LKEKGEETGEKFREGRMEGIAQMEGREWLEGKGGWS
jgi:hypothetical protein